MAKETKVTLIYFPYGANEPAWAYFGYLKKGQKYVYFRYYDEENQYPPWIKFNPSQVKVFDGWKQEIIDYVENFKKALRQWDEERRKAWQNAENEGRKLADKLYEQWRMENPPPTFSIPLNSLSPVFQQVKT